MIYCMRWFGILSWLATLKPTLDKNCRGKVADREGSPFPTYLSNYPVRRWREVEEIFATFTHPTAAGGNWSKSVWWPWCQTNNYQRQRITFKLPANMEVEQDIFCQKEFLHGFQSLSFSTSESEKARWRVGIANRKVYARPESFCAYTQMGPKIKSKQSINL